MGDIRGLFIMLNLYMIVKIIFVGKQFLTIFAI